MIKLSEEQMKKGRKRFLEQHPEIGTRIASITQAHADAMGIDLELLRAQETMKALGEYAYSERRDTQELFRSYIADTSEEFIKLTEARNVGKPSQF